MTGINQTDKITRLIVISKQVTTFDPIKVIKYSNYVSLVEETKMRHSPSNWIILILNLNHTWNKDKFKFYALLFWVFCYWRR